MPTYIYTAYGLNIHSQIPLPELLPARNGQADISICYGEAPASLPNSSSRCGIWEAVPGKFLLDVAQIARYFIIDGREIRVERAEGSTDDEVRAFLLGSALAALLQQRDILTLHASAIETDHGAVLFLGRSGSGKSTLLTSLVQRGYAMLADDVTGITLDKNGLPQALPAFPCARLWADVTDKLHYADRVLQRVRAELEKYRLPIDHFCNDLRPVHATYVLSSYNQRHIELETVESVDRFMWLYKYTYRMRFLRGLELESTHFKSATEVARQVKMTLVKRPIHPFLLDELVDLVEQDILD